MANPSGNRGHAGEQSMGFYWGERGYFLVDGPSGAGGHAANAAGFDGVAFNPSTGHMVIYDNKAFARSGNVYSATAISENLAKNLDVMHARVSARPDIPQQQTILANISNARAALTPGSGVTWPRNVQLAVSNASGQSTGVGGTLANGTISFIDYYTAPSPKPAATPSGSQSRTDKPWSGPGGTPGFNPSRIQGIASALAMFQRWAEQWSMLNAAIAAWNELMDREHEIIGKQQAHPERPVYIKIYWKVHFENNPHMPKRYEYFGAEIADTIGGTAALYDGWQKSYLMVIPPLTTAPKVPQAPGTWHDRYLSVLAAAQGDRSHGGDPIDALRILNGCAMFDILPILERLKTNEPFIFSKMEQAIEWPTANVARGRLTAAFVAARMKDGGSSAFLSYVNNCSAYHHLPDDQKNDIKQFFSPPAAQSQTSEPPTGEWTVRVAHWVWMYKFDDRGGVTWRDPFNGMSGKGKWTMKSATMRIDWIGSTTVDEWDVPLDGKTQSGKVRMKGQTYKLSATKA